MRKLITGVCFWLTCAGLADAAPVDIRGVRFWSAPDHTRVVFDLGAPVTHQLTTLHVPERLVIDVPAARLAKGFNPQTKTDGLVAAIRSAPQKDNSLRIVLDLVEAVRPRSFTLRPNDQYGHRLVVDLYDTGTVAATNRVKKSVIDKAAEARDLVIAIDAGHGGEDPGAIGRRGTREKDVVFSIAKQLAGLIEQEPGMRPVLVRQGDYYIGLRQRIDKARQSKADLFLSIHADGFRDHRVRGSSVYVLSRRGATSEMARWLAEKENSADLVGGVSLDDKDDLLVEVLLDLSQTATIEASLEVADNILGELGRLGKTHKATVQQAGFVVLKSPDIPSMLVETAFISNPSEEQKLRDKRHQKALARAMLRGVRSYFSKHPPPGTLFAARQHVIERGDTLSHIAARYKVGLNSLRGINELKSDRLRIGDVLHIPPAGS